MRKHCFYSFYQLYLGTPGYYRRSVVFRYQTLGMWHHHLTVGDCHRPDFVLGSANHQERNSHCMILHWSKSPRLTSHRSLKSRVQSHCKGLVIHKQKSFDIDLGFIVKKCLRLLFLYVIVTATATVKSGR